VNKLERTCRDFINSEYKNENLFKEILVGNKRDRIWVRLIPASAPHIHAELIQGFTSFYVDTSEGGATKKGYEITEPVRKVLRYFAFRKK
jgi:hypothetical protein